MEIKSGASWEWTDGNGEEIGMLETIPRAHL